LNQRWTLHLKPRLSAFVLVLAFLGLASAGALAMRPASRLVREAPARANHSKPPASPAPSTLTRQAVDPASPFLSLPPLEFVNLNTHKAASTRLYTDAGRVDQRATEKLNALLLEQLDSGPTKASAKATAIAAADGVKIAERTLQLIYRAAYHFRATRVEVVSAYRAPRRRRAGPHASGRAVDFKVVGTKAAALAAYLRTLPRVGVGVYTHPKTQYVHLDVRDESFHWLDASPPGKTWRERSLGTRALRARDAAYSRTHDWPEGTL
jgi:uncharacterized protein YcbK (DUF882 family)